jgi:hypothetical protein
MKFAREKNEESDSRSNYVIDITIVIRLLKVSIQLNKKRGKKGDFCGNHEICVSGPRR